MLNQSKNSQSKNIILIALITFFGCFFIYFFLYIERRILGIGPYYHPDSLHYFENYSKYNILSFSDSLSENLDTYFKNFFGNSLYPSIINLTEEIYKEIQDIKYLNFLHNTFHRYVISFNIMTNLLINILLLNYYLSNFRKNAYINKNFFILIIILFLPYKTHLSVNILKDIIILLPLVFFFTNRNIYSLFSSFIIATPLRFGAVIYYFLFFDYKNLNKKTIKALFILITIVSIFLFIKVVYNSYDNSGQDLITSIKEFLKARNNAVMGGRSFDAIPSFHEFKSGSLIRAAIWPIFFLTGTFSLFSESYFFYILSLEVLGIQFLIYYFYRKSIISINLILVLMIIGIYCNTFTSYFRYSYIVFYLSTLITFFGAIKNKN